MARITIGHDAGRRFENPSTPEMCRARPAQIIVLCETTSVDGLEPTIASIEFCHDKSVSFAIAEIPYFVDSSVNESVPTVSACAPTAVRTCGPLLSVFAK